MENLESEHVERLEKTLDELKKEDKRLRELWRKLATELRSFKVNCPFCKGEMRIMVSETYR